MQTFLKYRLCGPGYFLSSHFSFGLVLYSLSVILVIGFFVCRIQNCGLIAVLICL